MIKIGYLFLNLFITITLLFCVLSCKHKQKIQKSKEALIIATDLNNEKCKLEHKSSKTLSKLVKQNEFSFEWVSAKANVESLIDNNEESFDIKIKMRKDSAILISIQYVLGLEVAKILITKDSVKFVNYVQKNFFIGDFNFINNLLNADIDYDIIQALLFGNSADFYADDETKLKPVTDKQNCIYLLSTIRRIKLKKIQSGKKETKDAYQVLSLNPVNFKIIQNEFIDPVTNRKFMAKYSQFNQTDSAYAPHHVDIDIVAEKKASLKIDYVRIEKNIAQKLILIIPKKYDALPIQKK